MAKELIVAIGDLHGHYSALTSLIESLNKQYDLIDSDNRIRDDAVLISTGDSIDRGTDALSILAQFITLTKNNPDNFKALMGNHELMALADLDDMQSLLKDKDMWLTNCPNNSLLHHYKYTDHGNNGGVAFVNEFCGADDSEIIDNYLARMSKDGDIGFFMRGLLPRYEIEIACKHILFVHAGIPESIRDRDSLDAFIQNYHEHMDLTSEVVGRHKKYDSGSIVDGGVFWDRSYRDMDPRQIRIMLDNLNVDYMVTGHTPHKEGIKIFGDRIIDIDVGMCPAYGANTPAALVIDKLGIRAHYVGNEEKSLIKF